jgi:hypothetical protein
VIRQADEAAPQLLDHMHGYTPGDVERIQREAEEEAAGAARR